MIKKNNKSVDEALKRMQQICSRQEKCPADVMVLLKRRGIQTEDQQHIIRLLKADGYIDEKRFASAFVKDKIRFDHWGIIKIRYHLQHKGIARDISENVLREINQEEYRKMVEKELDKKRKDLTGPSRDIWAKLARYGSSRGYEMDTMQQFLDGIREDD
jgi:regulatory protein